MGAWAKIRVQIALGAGLVSMLMSAHATAGADVNQVKAKGKAKPLPPRALFDEPFEFAQGRQDRRLRKPRHSRTKSPSD